jgi:hypothetical protein
LTWYFPAEISGQKNSTFFQMFLNSRQYCGMNEIVRVEDCFGQNGQK